VLNRMRAGLISARKHESYHAAGGGTMAAFP
jgi:hypothetical protein